MATWSKATLADKVLSFLGVKPAGQSASAEDTNLVEDIVDSIHPQLDKLGLAPFATSAIPEWAQQPLVKYMAAEVAPYFGLPANEGQKHMARKELQEQNAGYDHPVPGKANYF